MSRRADHHLTRSLLALPLLWLAVGCAGKEFRAYDGPPDPATDVRLTIRDERVRVVSADGVAVPKAFGEGAGDRTLWLRGGRATPARLTLGIAPHPAVMKKEMGPEPMAIAPPAPGGGVHVTAGASQARGYYAAIDYPGSSRNQRITFAAQPAGQYVIALDGKLGDDKKPVWGFTVTDKRTDAAVPLGPVAWEANATGGVEATPWNLWALPDDAIEMRSTIYR